MKNATLTKMVRDIFNENDEVTLTMLYEKACELKSDYEVSKLKHIIRSIVHNMKKQNKIESVAPSTYKKI